MVRRACTVCGSSRLYEALDMGSMPSANNLVTRAQLNRVRSYPLKFYWCANCTLFQQLQKVPQDELFGGRYLYATGVNKPLVDHFRRVAGYAERISKGKRLAVVIASNDGTEIEMLQRHSGFRRVIGVEPSKNMARLANSRGLHTINSFFDMKTARRIVRGYGRADFIMANNVFAHIPDPKGMLLGMKELINNNGAILIEVHWLKTLVDKLQIDALYAEHYYVWNARAFAYLASLCGLKLTSVGYVPDAHGGSIRFVLRRHGSFKGIRRFWSAERRSGLYTLKGIKGLRRRAEERKRRLVRLVKGIKSSGCSIGVWGVSAKVPTLLNFCGITNREIDCAYDLTPWKIGRYIPRANILIKSEDRIMVDVPDYLIIGAWNYMDYALKKFKRYRKRGGRLIDPVSCRVL